MKEIEGVPEQPEIPVLEDETPKGPLYWAGMAPEKCDIGGEDIKDFFIDGKVRSGPWGFMCPTCHSRYGYGLGIGKGQSYKKQEDGRWLKVGG